MTMSSADHRAEAERYLTAAKTPEGDPNAVQDNLQRAQVHAMLALTRALEDQSRNAPKLANGGRYRV